MSSARETAPPRGFVRMYIDLEPDLSDWLSDQVKKAGTSKRAYIRALVLKDQQEKESSDGKGKGKK